MKKKWEEKKRRSKDGGRGYMQEKVKSIRKKMKKS